MHKKNFTIHLARSKHIQGIIRLCELVWKKQINYQQVLHVLSEDSHATHVATQNDHVIGFADGFITIAQDGTRRWELDLLAVDPEFRGQGIAKQLIRSNTKIGQESGCGVARALTATDNIAVHKALAHYGYRTDSNVFQLYVVQNQIAPYQLSYGKAHINPVNTIQYRGLWLEGQLTKNDIHAAFAIKTLHQMDLIGAALSSKDKTAIQLIEDYGFRLAGQYFWWRKTARL